MVMKWLGVALVIVLLGASPSWAQLPASDLQQAGISSAANARIPTNILWVSESGTSITIGQAMEGHPALLLFADYTCTTLCGPVLTFVADALVKSGLPPQDYRLVVLGIDPKDGPREAAAVKRERIVADGLAVITIFLTGSQQAIRQTAQAIGYHFVYDAAHDQFAHPAAVLALTADGRVTRVLSGLGISANDLRLALVEAGRGRIGTASDHVRLLCYGFDPGTGIYTLSIYRALGLASAGTVLILAFTIGWLLLRRPSLS